MATIVKTVDTDIHYILIGSGYGFGESNARGPFESHLKDQQAIRAVCLCDKEGHLFWMPSNKVRVVSIDGIAPNQH